MSPPLPAPNPLLHRTLWTLLILIVIGMFGYFVWKADKNLMAAASRTLPTYDVITPFSMTERSGRTVTEKDLLGKVCVVDFFFTSCPGPCPVMSQRLQQLQQSLNKTDKVRLISFSVDPETDTPEVLQAYAKRYFADPDKWWFLTGSSQDVQHLAVNVFRLPLSRNPDEDIPKVGKFLHSTRFILVDAKGYIRGYYNSYNNDGTYNHEFEPQLLRDIGLVMKEDGL